MSLLWLLVVGEVVVLILILIIVLLVELILVVVHLGVTSGLGKLEALGLLKLKLILVNVVVNVNIAVDLGIAVVAEARGKRLVRDLDDGSSVLGTEVLGQSSVRDGERVSDVKGVLLSCPSALATVNFDRRTWEKGKSPEVHVGSHFLIRVGFGKWVRDGRVVDGDERVMEHLKINF